MTPRVYVDLHVLGAGGDTRKPGADPRATSLVFGAVHGAMRSLPGRFAVAFPHGKGFLSVIRVFASDRQDIDAFAEALTPHSAVRDYAILGYPRTVPEDYSGPWVSYRRYRIPTRKADRKAGAPCRLRRLQFSEKHDLPYLIVNSVSTGQVFGLRFEAVKDVAPTSDAQPDGYGLARRSALFSVPDLPA